MGNQRYLIKTKHFRAIFYVNKFPKLDGFMGIMYDNYLKSNGPVEINLCFYFFWVILEFGKDF
jgi:hypothetical protein